MKYLIANWKSNLSMPQVISWVDVVKPALADLSKSQPQLHVVICPPFPFLDFLSQSFRDLPLVSIGAQNISHLGMGAHTGEVSAENLKGLATYTLIGHSERRDTFGETADILEMKVDEALKHHVTPVFCVRDSYDSVPDKVTLAAYEPVESIGTGENTPVADVLNAIATLSLPDTCACLYGGSVDADNIVEYFEEDAIAGVLVGSASLTPESFIQMVKNVATLLSSPQATLEDDREIDQG